MQEQWLLAIKTDSDMINVLRFTLVDLARAYAEGVSPAEVVAEAFARLDAANDPGILLHRAEAQALAEAKALDRPDGRPLWGVPFVVKDNIDVAGMPTTAACPDLSYIATEDAFVVVRLRAAGAIVLGKANLDQFATGLVGVRTPGPAPRNALDPLLVPGGVILGLGRGCCARDRSLLPRDRHGRFWSRTCRAERPGRAETDAGHAVGHRHDPRLPDAGHHLDLCPRRCRCLGDLRRGGSG